MERHARRQSSGSRSSLVTVKPLERSRSPSGSGRMEYHDPNSSSNSSGFTFGLPSRDKRGSASTKRSSTSARNSQQSYDPPSAVNRWAPATSPTSSSPKEHRRRSSLSVRLGLSVPSMGSATGMSRRTPSPSKKRRPADIKVGPTSEVTVQAKGATLAPTAMLPQGGTFYTLESPMIISEPRGGEPLRTPLLHENQFGANGADAPDAPDQHYRAPQDWTPPATRKQPDFRDVGDATTASSLEVEHSRSEKYRDVIPEMQQRTRNGSSTFYSQFESHEPTGHVSETDHGTSSWQRSKSSKDDDKDRRKNMLAAALQRATEAVELDQEEDYTAALAAYGQACEFLAQVADRSSSEVDKRKLRDIRTQYTARIREIELQDADGEVPHDDLSPTAAGSSQMEFRSSHVGMSGNDRSPEKARLTRIIEQPQTQALLEERRSAAVRHLTREMLSAPQHEEFMPRALTPRRPSPQPPPSASQVETDPTVAREITDLRDSRILDSRSEQQPSWLDGLEVDAGSSRPESNYSVSSLQQFRRPHLRMQSTTTEEDFDAALDAAVEAAYDDSFSYAGSNPRWSRPERLSQISESGSLASRDAYLAGRAEHLLSNQRDRPDEQVEHQASQSLNSSAAGEQSYGQGDEKQRTSDQVQQPVASDAAPRSASKSKLPRQSDSSSSSGRTWASSAASSLTTAGTLLSTVDETALPMRSKVALDLAASPPAPPPTGALPAIPTRSLTSGGHALTEPLRSLALPGNAQNTSLQDRRLSSRKGKTLTIETTPASRDEAHLAHQSMQRPEPTRATPPLQLTSSVQPIQKVDRWGENSSSQQSSATRNFSSPLPTPFQATFSDFSGSAMSPSTNITSAMSNGSSQQASHYSQSPNDPYSKYVNQRGFYHSNGSALSLKNSGLLTPNSEYDFRSPQTPLSSTMFASNIASPHVNGTFDKPQAQPRALEPCPESQILRPYWLMRCIYETVIHPDGGFLTTKLCIPRKIWLISNAKLKHVEEKVANCDLLTAALLKLGSTNTLDADAVLREMEYLEDVLSQAQTNLTKKLGNEVGAQNISSLFKDAPSGVMSPSDGLAKQDSAVDTAGNTNSTGNGKGPGRSYFSFKKLRGKASDNALAKTYTSIKQSTGAEGLKMSTVPMTTSLAQPSAKAAKRDGRSISPAGAMERGSTKSPEGVNAEYMSAVARLCDAVQVLDRIARQVEDPGLRHSSPTHVGLELSSKHAAEFFGLYICRFVLQDMMALAEKHLKKASEYVLT